MSDYRKYAAGVVISAGLFVTGVMWWQRPSPYIAGEDMAAFMADAVERSAVMMGAYYPSLSAITNTVYASQQWYENPGPTVQFSVGPAGALETLRNTFGFVYRRGIDLPWARPRWIDGAWPVGSLGTVLTYNFPAWHINGQYTNQYPFTITYHSISSPVSATPTYITLDTRVPVGSAVNYPIFEPTNLPAASDWPDCPLDGNGVAIIDGYTPYPGVGNWWTANGYGTNAYYLPEEIPYSPTNFFSFRLRSDAVSTNIFNHLRSVCGAMQEAVYIGGFVCVTGKTSNGYSALFASSTNQSDSAPTIHSSLMVDAMATAQTTALADVDGFGSVPVGFGKLIGKAFYDGYWLDRKDWSSHPQIPYERTDYTRIARANAYLEGAKYYGVHCQWPPEWAFASNLVKRIRYFAVWSASAPDNFAPQVLHTTAHPYDTFTSTAITPNTYRGKPFPDKVTRIMSDRPEKSIQSTGFDYHEFYQLDLVPLEKYVLHKIADISHPTTAPKVDIGVDVQDVETPFTVAQTASWFVNDAGGDEFYGYWKVDASRQGYINSHQINLESLICVVEFEFSNYMGGGKGEVYTPPWSTNAPPVIP